MTRAQTQHENIIRLNHRAWGANDLRSVLVPPRTKPIEVKKNWWNDPKDWRA